MLNEIYVKNDHLFGDGPMILIEDLAYGKLAPWTDLIYLEIADPITQTPKAGERGEVDDTAGVIEWTQKLIFQDDGHILRTASTVVLVAITRMQTMGRNRRISS